MKILSASLVLLLASGCGGPLSVPYGVASQVPSVAVMSAPSPSWSFSKTLTPTPIPSANMPPKRPKVLVIGLDGVRHDRIFAAKAPNLRELMRTGTFATGKLEVLKKVRSSSGPGWATVLTGVNPIKHGVYNNSFEGRQFARYPDFLTRLERIRPSLHTGAMTVWPSLVAVGAVSTLVDWHATGHDKPYKMGAKDALIVDRMTELIRISQIDVAFMHLEITDAVAHQEGVLGPAYLKAIDVVDGYVGRLSEAIRARPTFPSEGWTIITTTDHGHKDEGGHGGDSPKERRIFVLAAGPGIPVGARRRDARQVDVAATVFAQLGIPLPGDLGGRSLGVLEPVK